MTAKAQNKSGYDLMILIPTLALLGLGLVAIYSASSILADLRYSSSNIFIKKQAVFALLGIFLMITVKNIPVSFYRKLVYPALVISFILLVLLFVPGMARKVGGANRWLALPWLSIQPSELVKITLAVFMAYSMSKKGVDMSSFSKGLVPHLLIVGAFMVLIVLQPDLGTTVIIGCWMMMMLFVGGLNFIHLLFLLILACPTVLWLINHADYRLNRWSAFINPWEDPLGLGFQIIHSFLAFGAGGLFGVGLGNSRQKLLYLPEPHTDFILSIIAEELGLVGISIIVILFAILVIRGIKISLDAPDLYSSYLALGISIFLGLQVIINMGVVMGLLPTKGLTLPLISYGGSSLLVNLIGIGMLLSISARK